MRVKLRAKVPEKTIQQLDELQKASGMPTVEHLLVAMTNQFYAGYLHTKKQNEGLTFKKLKEAKDICDKWK